jgi:hypothetical protein
MVLFKYVRHGQPASMESLTLGDGIIALTAPDVSMIRIFQCLQLPRQCFEHRCDSIADDELRVRCGDVLSGFARCNGFAGV